MQKNCLIVDDSKIVRKISRKIMETIGYNVTEAEDGAKALEQCMQTMPDLILLDWHMPVMDGLQFLKALRATEAGKAPVVIFCTTENEIGHIQQAIQEGANEYVMKPFDEDILRSKLSQVGLL